MQMERASAAATDPYFGPGEHDGDPQPGWYAATSRSDADVTDATPAFDMARLFTEYEAVSEALAADDSALAVEAARRLEAAAESLGPIPEHVPDADFAKLVGDFRDYAGRLARAENLDAERAAFRDLSGSVTVLARRYGVPGLDVRLIFCPMAFHDTGAFWLQREAQVSNPYHGQEMLRCGWEVEAIPAK